MGTMSLNSIILNKLNNIEVEGGNVIHLIKSSDKNFHEFGEAYFSIVKPKLLKLSYFSRLIMKIIGTGTNYSKGFPNILN